MTDAASSGSLPSSTPKLGASGRRWAVAGGCWGLVCSIVLVLIGISLAYSGQIPFGALVLAWAAAFFAGSMVTYHWPGSGLLILAVQASMCAVFGFAMVMAARGVEASREAGVGLLLHLVNAAAFVVGLERVGRANAAGPSLLRPWAAALLIPCLGLLTQVPSSLELRILSLTVATIAATIAGVNIVKGGDRGLRWPSRPALFCAIAPVAGALLSGLGWLYVRLLVSWVGPHVAELGLVLGSAPALLKIATLILLIPACEELLFRGAIQGSLRSAWDPWPSILTSAALFSLVHLAPLMMPWLIVVGIALGWMRERSGSLLPGFLLHVAVNAVTFLALPPPR